MSNTRKNTDAEWEVHKRDIETLYLAENKTRDEVMQAMEETHGFRARFEIPFLLSQST
jgi:hypothetical protein